MGFQMTETAERSPHLGLSPGEANPEHAVRDLVSFLTVPACDGGNMIQIDAGGG